MANLVSRPTTKEREEAATEGWYCDESGKVWTKYEFNTVTVLDLKKFEWAFERGSALLVEEREKQ